MSFIYIVNAACYFGFSGWKEPLPIVLEESPDLLQVKVRDANPIWMKSTTV